MPVDKVYLRHLFDMNFRYEAMHELHVRTYMTCMLGSEVVNVWNCQILFQRFQPKRRSLTWTAIQVLQLILEINPHLTTRAIAKVFGSNQSTAKRYTKHLEFILKPSIWILHNFKIQ